MAVWACAVQLGNGSGTSMSSSDRWVGGLPIGVQPKFATRYQIATTSGRFSCLDGTDTSVPVSSLNDDFCDCDDGSDEPGTAACAGYVGDGIGFWCGSGGASNAGELVASSRVNDGICDCCDGSDEFESGASCEGRCMPIVTHSSAQPQTQQEAVSGRVTFEDILRGLQIKRERSGLGAGVAYREKVARLGRAESEMHALRIELIELDNQLRYAKSERLDEAAVDAREGGEGLYEARLRRRTELGLLQQEPITPASTSRSDHTRQRYVAQYSSQLVPGRSNQLKFTKGGKNWPIMLL